MFSSCFPNFVGMEPINYKMPNHKITLQFFAANSSFFRNIFTLPPICSLSSLIFPFLAYEDVSPSWFGAPASWVRECCWKVIHGKLMF